MTMHRQMSMYECIVAIRVTTSGKWHSCKTLIGFLNKTIL